MTLTNYVERWVLPTKTKKKEVSKYVPIPDAMPSLLCHNADNVGLGAVLMRLGDNRRAVVVDSILREGEGNEFIIAYVSDNAMRRLDENSKHEPVYPHEPKDYTLERIHCAASGWLVLHLGQDQYDMLVD